MSDDPRRVVLAVLTPFTRGPPGRRDAGDRWDVQYFNARGNLAAPRWDYPSLEQADAAVARLATRLGYPILVELADADAPPRPSPQS